MFSGKTEELIRRLRRVEYARQKLQVFKPKIDNRYHLEDVTSHDQNRFPAKAVDRAIDILRLIERDTKVVGIDEGQFFDATLIDVVETLADRGIRVIIAGLDTDWKAEPFEPMPTLMAMAEQVTKQSAVCVVCGEAAHRTQRVASAKPVENVGQVLVGAQDHYEARCRSHFSPQVVAPFIMESKTQGSSQTNRSELIV